MKTHDLLAAAGLTMAVATAARILADNIKDDTVALLRRSGDPAVISAGVAGIEAPVALVHDLVRVMGEAAQGYLATLDTHQTAELLPA